MQTILVGLDGSDRAHDVLEAACALAQKAQAKLVLFQAVGLPPHLPEETLGMPPGDIGEFLRQRALTYLEACAERVPAGAFLRARADIGTPWRSICRAAEEEGADLVVIGSHGYDAVDRVLGTTAAKVVNHTECSVLVVRKPRLLD